MRIFVDADACPVKAEIYKVADRHGLSVTLVANSRIAVPRQPGIEMVVVSGKADAADDWIAERAEPGDIVVTADIPLASRCVRSGAHVITPHGRQLTDDSIGMALATRDLLDAIRSAGETTGGPRPFSRQDRSSFLQALDRVIVRAGRSPR
jgi:uncharacterized protein YaiI (UPF0178 family)